MSQDIIILSKNVNNANNFILYTNAYKRKNIWVPANSITNTSIYTGNIRNYVTWYSGVNCYYNTAYNIYVYYNL